MRVQDVTVVGIVAVASLVWVWRGFGRRPEHPPKPRESWQQFRAWAPDASDREIRAGAWRAAAGLLAALVIVSAITVRWIRFLG